MGVKIPRTTFAELWLQFGAAHRGANDDAALYCAALIRCGMDPDTMNEQIDEHIKVGDLADALNGCAKRSRMTIERRRERAKRRARKALRHVPAAGAE